MIALLDQPHAEAKQLIATGAPVFLTINPVEFHGPHLSLHNDRLVSLGLARALHARLAPELPFLLGADLEVGVDPCPGPGTRHTPFAVVRRLVVEACRALCELGARRVVLMTFHGSPLHALAIEGGVQEVARHGGRAIAPFNAVLQELLGVDASRYASVFAPVPDAADRAQLAAELHLDFHAGFAETSLALHLAPDSVSPSFKSLPPCPPFAAPRALGLAARVAKRLPLGKLGHEVGFGTTALGWYALRPFPGYTSRPHLANAASGAALAEIILARYLELTSAVFAGTARSPEPILRWTYALTLGGRVGSPGIPDSEVARLARA